MLTALHILVSLVLITLILLQERGSGFSSVLGGLGGTPYHTRRGMEKMIFIGTVASGSLFVLLAIVNLVL